MSNKPLMAKLKNIKLVITDIDGVMTDACFYYNADGDFLKKFNTRDGMGITLLQTIGIKVAITTGEMNQIVEQRAEKLRITDIFMGIQDKAIALDELCHKYSLKPEQVVYIGDDINDVGIMKKAGVAVAVSDALPEVKVAADYITDAPGGGGAVREVANLILKAKGRNALDVLEEAINNAILPRRS